MQEAVMSRYTGKHMGNLKYKLSGTKQQGIVLVSEVEKGMGRGAPGWKRGS